jgi:zinc protease
MPTKLIKGCFALLFLLAASCGQKQPTFHVPVEYYKLDNGLKVVFSVNHQVPTVTVAVYYGIGFRNEPKGLTGFSHLFEHLMFEGTPNMPKGEFDNLIEGGGGVDNGSTRFDFTNYFEVVPSNQLEPILWTEADRMREINFLPENLENQVGVVSNEVKVNVLNAPYGGFPWLDVPQYANTNWYNAHNFYGDLEDLQKATPEDVKKFFYTYYRPNNAVLVVAGDFDSKEAKKWIASYFSTIPASQLPPRPDMSEPPQQAEKKASRQDPFAPEPALALAYHMPDRGTPEYYAMGLLDSILVQGEDSRLYQKLVKEDGITDGVFGGINLIGNMYNYSGPMLFTVAFIHDRNWDEDAILKEVDSVLADVQANGVTEAEFERAITKFRSGFYDLAGSATRFGLVDLLASFALFDDNPGRINTLEADFRKVTPELIQRTASEVLRASNRTVLAIEPGAGGEGGQ